MKQKFIFLGLGIALPAVFMTGLVFYFGSFDTAVSWLNGKPCAIFPTIYRLNVLSSGNEEIATFFLRNLSGETLSVSGVESSCSCVFTDDIPVTVPPKASADLKLRVRLPENRTGFDQSVVFVITTSKQTIAVPVRITATTEQSISEKTREFKDSVRADLMPESQHLPNEGADN